MEETVEKKRGGWPKGKKRGPRKAPVAPPMFVAAPEPEAPIHVIVHLRNGCKSEFGCARRTVENGFHVFFYPSETDRYRETRREFAISEITEIEITEARQSAFYTTKPETITTYTGDPIPPVTFTTGPQIHSVRKNANSIIGALENSSGPIKMDKMPSLTFGDSEA